MAKSLRQRVKNNLIYWAFLSLVSVIRATPEKWAMATMSFLGRIAFRVAPGERRKTINNLTKIFGNSLSEPEIAKKGEAVFQYIAKNGCAALRIPNYIREGLENWVRVEGAEHIDDALARGKGAVGLTGHIGCWELMAAHYAQNAYPLAVVGKKVYDPRLDKLLVGWRQQFGMHNFPRDGAGRQILQWLKKGGFVGILIDQDTKVDSEFVPFMGHNAKTPIAPMLLAQRVGAAIVPMAVHMQDDGTHVVTVLPELELEDDDGSAETRKLNLTRCNEAIEQLIRIDDRQWVWMHERWKSQPSS